MLNSLGQLIILGLAGTELTQEEKDFIRDENIGGVILFSRNYENPEQLAQLVNSIQALRGEYPLFISVDNEGGRVFRFRQGFLCPPPMLQLAKVDSPKIVYEVHKIMAEELRACGINLDFSPVCDIFSNPANQVIGDRAFGMDPETVCKYVSSAIRGLQANGVMACAKHFPGHGDTVADSHLELPVLNKSLEELRDFEFLPFLKANKSRVDFMMVAHLHVPALDQHLPTSLSPHTYKFIREEIKFNKLIITDDLEMNAILNHFTLPEASVMALNAGTDILLYRSLKAAQDSLHEIKDQLKRKILSKGLLEEKIQSVLSLKKHFFSEYNPLYIPSVKEIVGKKVNQKFFKDLEEKLKQLTKTQS